MKEHATGASKRRCLGGVRYSGNRSGTTRRSFKGSGEFKLPRSALAYRLAHTQNEMMKQRHWISFAKSTSPRSSDGYPTIYLLISRCNCWQLMKQASVVDRCFTGFMYPPRTISPILLGTIRSSGSMSVQKAFLAPSRLCKWLVEFLGKPHINSHLHT